MNAMPRMVRVRQNFARGAVPDTAATVAREAGKLAAGLRPGARVAVAVGSRGITNLAAIVRGTIDVLQAAGAVPFIIPAMGSHGGATPEGQRTILADYGVTEAAMGVPVRPSLEVQEIGRTPEGAAVVCSTEAMAADGIVLINRIKPHTDFFGTLGSGLLKMAVIGLGKHAGAAAMHRAASWIGHERSIRGMAKVIVARAPLLGGLAILENQFHETAKIVAIPRAEMETAEETLLEEARALLPRLPFGEIDLLIVDWIGKNISGAGLDPNVTNRWVQGYIGGLMREDRPLPFVRRLFVRDVTPESHGNAIGIGLADVTTTRLVRAMDRRATAVNSLTSLTPGSAKIPIAFDTDREAVEAMLVSLCLDDAARQARIVRIESTLVLTEMEVSETAWADVSGKPGLELLAGPREMGFGADGNLPPVAAGG
ncbi:MAG: hypothetical protein B9S34_11510 [Opitutia bacterium Tous-C1TDCM]|nr:MAG: hypothetical protein B9S34_11510 [Opitutae bacterium Tous-C1TDCM]